MGNVSISKDVGLISAIGVLHYCSKHLYPSNEDGASGNHKGILHNTVIHLTGSPNTSDAVDLLNDIQKPTCTSSLLKITVNCGNFVVNDQTDIVADPTNTKYVKVTLVLNDSSGAVEVYIFEKTVGSYGSLPAGKTHICNLKEFSVLASGTSLTLVKDFIN